MSEFRIDQIKSQDASRGPDVAGITTFTGTSGIVMPSGATEYRGGRGIALAGGNTVPGNTTTANLNKIHVATTGNAISFSELSSARTQPGTTSSSTRGFFFGGTISPYAAVESTIDYIVFSSGGGVTDFGSLTQSIRAMSDCSGDTVRGIRWGGYGAPVTTNVIDYITYSSTGNANDFGDITSSPRYACHGVSSPVRSIIMAGASPSGTGREMEYVVTQTTGNSITFGELPTAANDGGGVSDTTRGISFGSGAHVNTMEYITMSSLGNSQDFGDLTVGRGPRGASNSTRGVMLGGASSQAPTNMSREIDYITIQTIGNATDFGDLTEEKQQLGACSDIHGGLG